MSVAELKKQIAGLSSKERFQISAFLAKMEKKSEAECRAEVERSMKSMDAGNKITGVELKKLHQKAGRRGPINGVGLFFRAGQGVAS